MDSRITDNVEVITLITIGVLLFLNRWYFPDDWFYLLLSIFLFGFGVVLLFRSDSNS